MDQRAEGTIAALAVCAWLGARVFRVHDVPAARQALAAITELRTPGLSLVHATPVTNVTGLTIAI